MGKTLFFYLFYNSSAFFVFFGKVWDFHKKRNESKIDKNASCNRSGHHVCKKKIFAQIHALVVMRMFGRFFGDFGAASEDSDASKPA